MSRYETGYSKNYSSVFWIVFVLGLLVAMILLYTKNEQETEGSIKSLVIPVEKKVVIKTEAINLPVEAPETIEKIEQAPKDLIFVQNQIKPLDLDLEQSDTEFKAALTALSKNLGSWINVKDIIKKYIVIINDLSQKQITYKNRKFLKMPQAMQVEENATGLYMSEKSYQRYDLLANAIADINVEKALGVYLKFKPLFQQVYNEFAYPDNYHLEDIFIKASAAIIQAPVLEKKIKLVRHSVGYKFADKKLEAMNAVNKQMLRMGVKNTQKIQQKLKQFVQALILLNE